MSFQKIVSAVILLSIFGLTNSFAQTPQTVPWANSQLQSDQGGSIELGAPATQPSAPGSLPYIDFHFGNGQAQDFNTRIINDGDGVLSVYTVTGGKAFSVAGTNVGVDNPTPRATGRNTLDVNGEIIANPRLTLSQDLGTTTPTWHLDNFGSTQDFRIFWQPNIDTAGTVVMSATTAGNVGIGASDPANKLDVAGNIGIRGAGNGIRFPDGTLQTTAAGNTQPFSSCSSFVTSTQARCGCTGKTLSQQVVSGGGGCTASTGSSTCSASSEAIGANQTNFGVCCVCE